MEDVFVEALRREELGDAVTSALRQLLSRDFQLLEIDAN